MYHPKKLSHRSRLCHSHLTYRHLSTARQMFHKTPPRSQHCQMDCELPPRAGLDSFAQLEVILNLNRNKPPVKIRFLCQSSSIRVHAMKSPIRLEFLISWRSWPSTYLICAFKKKASFNIPLTVHRILPRKRHNPSRTGASRWYLWLSELTRRLWLCGQCR